MFYCNFLSLNVSKKLLLFRIKNIKVTKNNQSNNIIVVKERKDYLA